MAPSSSSTKSAPADQALERRKNCPRPARLARQKRKATAACCSSQRPTILPERDASGQLRVRWITALCMPTTVPAESPYCSAPSIRSAAREPPPAPPLRTILIILSTVFSATILQTPRRILRQTHARGNAKSHHNHACCPCLRSIFECVSFSAIDMATLALFSSVNSAPLYDTFNSNLPRSCPPPPSPPPPPPPPPLSITNVCREFKRSATDPVPMLC